MTETIHETWLASLTSRRAADIDAALEAAEDAETATEHIRALEGAVAELVDEVGDLEAEVARLRDALMPFAHHAPAGGDAYPERESLVIVTEGQLTRAWKALHDGD